MIGVSTPPLHTPDSLLSASPPPKPHTHTLACLYVHTHIYTYIYLLQDGPPPFVLLVVCRHRRHLPHAPRPPPLQPPPLALLRVRCMCMRPWYSPPLVAAAAAPVCVRVCKRAGIDRSSSSSAAASVCVPAPTHHRHPPPHSTPSPAPILPQHIPCNAAAPPPPPPPIEAAAAGTVGVCPAPCR